eukprot:TRINITY_DN7907_c0_g1_i1.p1 TRINITY_DN7907_c0_g1~~TRINITY_DN7907_c0_g1_i1.p1  ORF type:complete len:155 (-),score=6.76 TRINITY_DN7907_c0_g1_i1:83-547(-)
MSAVCSSFNKYDQATKHHCKVDSTNLRQSCGCQFPLLSIKAVNGIMVYIASTMVGPTAKRLHFVLQDGCAKSEVLYWHSWTSCPYTSIVDLHKVIRGPSATLAKATETIQQICTEQGTATVCDELGVDAGPRRHTPAWKQFYSSLTFENQTLDS